MPLYSFWCECGHKWEEFRHISQDVPEKPKCPRCKAKGLRSYHARINEFTPYWTDGLTGDPEYIDSKHTEIRREKETGKTRLPSKGSARLSRPTEMR